MEREREIRRMDACNYTTCNECGRLIPDHHLVQLFDDSLICRDCFNRHYSACSNCGETGNDEYARDDFYVYRDPREPLGLPEAEVAEVKGERETIYRNRALDETMVGVILRYYKCAAEDNPIRPTPYINSSDLLKCAKYMAATATCELRYMENKCTSFFEPGREVFEKLLKWRMCFGGYRASNAENFLNLTEKWNDYDYELYLRGAAYLFWGDWEGGYGGRNWAACCWYAAEWIKEVSQNNGYAPVMAWEYLLGATHNNGAWLSKLGSGAVFVTLNMGAVCTPEKLILACDVYHKQASAKSLPVCSTCRNSSCDFRRTKVIKCNFQDLAPPKQGESVRIKLPNAIEENIINWGHPMKAKRKIYHNAGRRRINFYGDLAHYKSFFVEGVE